MAISITELIDSVIKNEKDCIVLTNSHMMYRYEHFFSSRRAVDYLNRDDISDVQKIAASMFVSNIALRHGQTSYLLCADVLSLMQSKDKIVKDIFTTTFFGMLTSYYASENFAFLLIDESKVALSEELCAFIEKELNDSNFNFKEWKKRWKK